MESLLFITLLVFQLVHFTFTQTTYETTYPTKSSYWTTYHPKTTYETTYPPRTTYWTTRYPSTTYPPTTYPPTTYPTTTYPPFTTRSWRTTPLTEFQKRFITSENNLKEIKSKLLGYCEKMDSRPVLARECYEEVVVIMDLELELKTTRTLDELILVERSLEQIAIKVDRIEKDLNG